MSARVPSAAAAAAAAAGVAAVVAAAARGEAVLASVAACRQRLTGSSVTFRQADLSRWGLVGLLHKDDYITMGEDTYLKPLETGLLPDLVFTLLSHSLGMMNGSKKGSKKDPAEVFKICKDVRGAASRHLSARQRYT